LQHRYSAALFDRFLVSPGVLCSTLARANVNWADSVEEGWLEISLAVACLKFQHTCDTQIFVESSCFRRLRGCPADRP
jgi:hypothetical protein